MKIATQPFETIYILLSGFKTIKDGDVMALFAMDEFSGYAFPFVLEKLPKNDQDIQKAVSKLLKGIKEKIKNEKYFGKTSYITNLPMELQFFILAEIKSGDKIFFNEELTKQNTAPMVQSLLGYMNNEMD
ncbi:MAG: hypothetical protein JXR58_05905 [Bacteroidales bacterium]|nr:hypothetical protein [Bacteroidales bacterium]